MTNMDHEVAKDAAVHVGKGLFAAVGSVVLARLEFADWLVQLITHVFACGTAVVSFGWMVRKLWLDVNRIKRRK